MPSTHAQHTRPYLALNIAFLPVLADTMGRLHDDALRREVVAAVTRPVLGQVSLYASDISFAFVINMVSERMSYNHKAAADLKALGVYRPIAVPLYEGEAHRRVCLRLLLAKLCASFGGGGAGGSAGGGGAPSAHSPPPLSVWRRWRRRAVARVTDDGPKRLLENEMSQRHVAASSRL